ncbi:MAG: glycosyltransferase [Candidatus Omnitrophica bacterium]|nr:glycosyltransferase [Candidatus Omnitrophota bacterium]
MLKISVIIPTYNRANYICNAIDSVLAQTYKDFEIIVVDDGSTDNTKEILTTYGGSAKYIYQQNQGVSSARNRGIKEAIGEYVAFLDSDDEWDERKLEKQVKLFEKEPSVYLQYCYARFVNVQEKRDFIMPEYVTRTFEDLVLSHYKNKNADLPTSTVMIRKLCFDQIGCFDENLPCIEDYELWLRIAKKFAIGFIPEILVVENCHHTNNLTDSVMKMRQGYIGVYKKMIMLYGNEIDKTPFITKLARYYYLLAKEEYGIGLYSDASTDLRNALKIRLDIGRLFWIRYKDGWAVKMFKLLKPYIFLMLIYCKIMYSCQRKIANG